jgi:hypothetical protein
MLSSIGVNRIKSFTSAIAGDVLGDEARAIL